MGVRRRPPAVPASPRERCSPTPRERSAAQALFQPNTRYVRLSPREREVLDGHLRGQTDRGIARDLGRSVHTVSTISRNLREQFGMKMEDIVAAVRRGDWTIRRSEDKFNLHSAIALLEEGLRAMDERMARLPHRRDRIRVLLHQLELEALLALGRAVVGSERSPNADT
ncbi:MAG: hypothetical protein JO036_18490 [Candidatus Eremiobacteraeota bacterium]|nr:hypothetical protein [Candidatus Eremiobacteraeota bacterium]